MRKKIGKILRKAHSSRRLAEIVLEALLLLGFYLWSNIWDTNFLRWIAAIYFSKPLALFPIARIDAINKPKSS